MGGTQATTDARPKRNDGSSGRPDSAEVPCEVPDADGQLPEVPEPPGPTDGCGRPRSRVRRVLGKVVPPLISLGALYAAISMAGGLTDGWQALRAMQPAWIVVALACEVGSFALLSFHLRCLAGPPANARRLAPVRTALLVFGLGSVLPAAPVEGLTMATAALHHRRLARRRTALVLGMSQWFATTGLYVLAALNALVVVAVLHLPLNRWLLGLAAVATLAGIAIAGYLCTRRAFAEWVALAMGRLRSPRHPQPADERRERGAAWHDAAMHVVSGPRAWALLLGSAAGAWFADAMCLYAGLLALGAHVAVPLLLLAYAGSAIAAELPFLPAGVGVVEAAAPALLALGGVPAATALAAIVIYRLLGTALPAVCGAIALAWLKAEPAPAPVAAEGDGAPPAEPVVARAGVGADAGSGVGAAAPPVSPVLAAALLPVRP